jgi:hypothetical protein
LRSQFFVGTEAALAYHKRTAAVALAGVGRWRRGADHPPRDLLARVQAGLRAALHIGHRPTSIHQVNIVHYSDVDFKETVRPRLVFLMIVVLIVPLAGLSYEFLLELKFSIPNCWEDGLYIGNQASYNHTFMFIGRLGSP